MLKDKIAIVTGAASGIGLEITKGLLRDECVVVQADLNEAKAHDASSNQKAFYKHTDLSIRKSCKELVNYTIEKFGRVDILINVAGFQHVCPIHEFPEEKWDSMIQIMLTAPFLLTKYVWPSMKENRWGRIININSIHGLVASEYKSAYVSAKHGLNGFTKVAALEGAPLGITVNSICPAYVRTPLVEQQITSQARLHNIGEEEVITKIMLQKSAIKQMVDPKIIVKTIEFLCSEEASTITGIALPIDGGWTAS